MNFPLWGHADLCQKLYFAQDKSMNCDSAPFPMPIHVGRALGPIRSFAVSVLALSRARSQPTQKQPRLPWPNLSSLWSMCQSLLNVRSVFAVFTFFFFPQTVYSMHVLLLQQKSGHVDIFCWIWACVPRNLVIKTTWIWECRASEPPNIEENCLCLVTWTVVGLVLVGFVVLFFHFWFVGLLGFGVCLVFLFFFCSFCSAIYHLIKFRGKRSSIDHTLLIMTSTDVSWEFNSEY